MALNKTERMELRLTPLEKEKLVSQAEKARMNMSEYLIALSEQKKIYVVPDIPNLVTELNRIGTNVNQIALVANVHKTVSQKQLDIVNENLIEIQNLFGKLLDKITNSDDEIVV